MKTNIILILLFSLVLATYVCPIWYYKTMKTTIYFNLPPEGTTLYTDIVDHRALFYGQPEGNHPLYTERWHGRYYTVAKYSDAWPKPDLKIPYPEFKCYMIVKTRVKDEGIKDEIISAWLDPTGLNYQIGDD